MQTTANEYLSNDQYAAWQTANGAVWCKRLAATITASVCEENKQRSVSPYSGDLRCRFCGGLDNQEHDEMPVADDTADDCIEGLAALDELIESLYEEPEPGDDFDDIELDLDEDELLALFPELAGKDESLQRPFREYQTAAPRRAVYRGKCKRCGGWVGDTRERDDDSVFRCLLCGWRTSEAYERNRAIFAAGG